MKGEKKENMTKEGSKVKRIKEGEQKGERVCDKGSTYAFVLHADESAGKSIVGSNNSAGVELRGGRGGEGQGGEGESREEGNGEHSDW